MDKVEVEGRKEGGRHSRPGRCLSRVAVQIGAWDTNP